MMISGAALMGLQLAIIAFGPALAVSGVKSDFDGLGLLHDPRLAAGICQRIVVEARATALSLHSFFFFMGQTVGPIAYGFGILNAGKVPTLLTSAVIIVVLWVCLRAAIASDEAGGRGIGTSLSVSCAPGLSRS